VEVIYRRAWEWGLKGITIFRYGSKGQQVLEVGARASKPIAHALHTLLTTCERTH